MKRHETRLAGQLALAVLAKVALLVVLWAAFVHPVRVDVSVDSMLTQIGATALPKGVSR